MKWLKHYIHDYHFSTEKTDKNNNQFVPTGRRRKQMKGGANT